MVVCTKFIECASYEHGCIYVLYGYCYLKGFCKFQKVMEDGTRLA